MLNYSKLLQEANWLPSDEAEISKLSESKQSWLLLSSSLTEQLTFHFGKVQISVIFEGWVTDISETEEQLFQLEKQFWCREVLLHTDKKALVFARTLIPERVLSEYTELQTLGNTALGEWLFCQTNRIRKSLQWTKMPQTNHYARRALVEINHYPIMVAELFLDNQIFTKEKND